MKKKTKKIMSAVLAVLILATMFTGIIGTVTAHATTVPEKTTEQTTSGIHSVAPPRTTLNQEAQEDDTTATSKQPNASKPSQNNKPVEELEPIIDVIGPEPDTSSESNPNKDNSNNDKDTNKGSETTDNATGIPVTIVLNKIKSTGQSATVKVVIKNMSTGEKYNCEFLEAKSFTLQTALKEGKYKVMSIDSNAYDTLSLSSKKFTITKDTENVSLDLKKCEVDEGFFKHLIKNNMIFIILLFVLTTGLIIVKKKQADSITK